MNRKPALLASALPALALLSACGDDLESRQAAAEERQPSEQFIEDEVEARSAPAPAAASAPEADDGGDADGGEEEPLQVDAAPDDLIDSATGFAPEPMDDARGFDPSPVGAEPLGE